MLVHSAVIPALGLFSGLTAAAYTLQDDYGNDESFFNKFDFFTVGLAYLNNISPCRRTLT